MAVCHTRGVGVEGTGTPRGPQAKRLLCLSRLSRDREAVSDPTHHPSAGKTAGRVRHLPRCTASVRPKHSLASTADSPACGHAAAEASPLVDNKRKTHIKVFWCP